MNSYKKIIKNSFKKDGYEVALPDINHKDVSICFVNTESNRKTYCKIENSPIYYYIISGKGKFIIDDDTFDVKAGDLIEIPENKKYTYSGTLNMLELIPNSFNKLQIEESSVNSIFENK